MPENTYIPLCPVDLGHLGRLGLPLVRHRFQLLCGNGGDLMEGGHFEYPPEGLPDFLAKGMILGIALRREGLKAPLHHHHTLLLYFVCQVPFTVCMYT